MISYKNKSYLKVGKESLVKLVPIVINEDKSYTSFPSNSLKDIPSNECKMETIETFLAKGNYFKNEQEFVKKVEKPIIEKPKATKINKK